MNYQELQERVGVSEASDSALGDQSLHEPQEHVSAWQQTVLDGLSGTPTGRMYLGNAEVVAVKAESDPMGFYYVCIFPDRRTCTCKGFRFRETCKHVKDVAL